MSLRPLVALILACTVALLEGCATRPINTPIAEVNRNAGYRFGTRQLYDIDSETMVMLAFSGGGTRAAAFSYGVLEALRCTEVVTKAGKTVNLLDGVDIITGVSGGSFTALAYGLYGDRLFDEYEKRFLKRNVQGDLVSRFLSPKNWSALWSEGWGRSEMAAEMYDDILFNGATFSDLDLRNGPLIVTAATDISSGSRISFLQSDFDLLCSNLDSVPLVLSPVTINNYGGTCGMKPPRWAQLMSDPRKNVRPSGRALQRLKEMNGFENSKERPYLHLVDGGRSDNLGMRGMLEMLEELEAVRSTGATTRLDNVRRLVVFVVNSLSVPKTNWDQSARPPNDFVILLKATGVPIDRYSYEAVELLKDIVARWKTLRRMRDAGIFANGAYGDLAALANVPDMEIYAIDVSFSALQDKAEHDYLNDLPTSFVLSDEAVDRLRAAAGTIVEQSPEFQRLLQDMGARVLPKPVVSKLPAP